jgi:mevalonate kinase
MKWRIPAKTFLVGEYAALSGAPAILLTTTPCFELSLTGQKSCHEIHPDSPAGRWWAANHLSHIGLQWHDPYQGCGGLGASSAQFLGAYLASRHLQNKPDQKKDLAQQALLQAYVQSAWDGQGVCPSGYDVLAQSGFGCVYIDQKKALIQNYSWPFSDISFLLLHTGQKLRTHHHLQTMVLPSHMGPLMDIVDQARTAFEQSESHLLTTAVNAYHKHLAQLGLVAAHSMEQIAWLKEHPDVLAVKGCGAMGADVLLLLVSREKQRGLSHDIYTKGWTLLATSNDLYSLGEKELT